MSEQLRSFWQDRYARLGHTGWSDGAVYAYDQLERLALIERTITSGRNPGKIALDFGCGSGDISLLLIRRGFEVYGFDPYVRPDIQEDGFTYLSLLEDLEALTRPFDLIISVTVLDHILDTTEFVETLRLLRRKVADHGRLVVIEYAVDGTAPRNPNFYQAFRRLEKWHSHLYFAGWKIVSLEPVPTVPDSPSLGFSEFQRSLRVRLLRRVLNSGGLGVRTAHALMKRCAATAFKRAGIGQVASSPLKMMICDPILKRHAVGLR